MKIQNLKMLPFLFSTSLLVACQGPLAFKANHDQAWSSSGGSSTTSSWQRSSSAEGTLNYGNETAEATFDLTESVARLILGPDFNGPERFNSPGLFGIASGQSSGERAMLAPPDYEPGGGGGGGSYRVAPETPPENGYDSDFISKDEFPATHGSSLVVLSTGEILACWYAGEKEGASDVQMVCAKRNNEGHNWNTSYVVVPRQDHIIGGIFPNDTVGNAALYRDSSNVLWLFYPAVPFGGWSMGRIAYKTSIDNGSTWSSARLYTPFFGNLVRSKPIEISGNQFMLPAYHELTKKQAYSCLITSRGTSIRNSVCRDIPGEEHMQPTLVRLNSDQIVAYLRNSAKGAVLSSTYSIRRKSWSQPTETNLPNPDAAVEALAGPSGTTLVVYNDSLTVRNPLSLAVTRDGVNFTKIYDFENQQGLESSYPALIRDDEGIYHLSYTYDGRLGIKHVRFTEAWLIERMVEAGAL